MPLRDRIVVFRIVLKAQYQKTRFKDFLFQSKLAAVNVLCQILRFCMLAQERLNLTHM